MYTDIITYRRSVVDVLYPDSVVPSYIHHDFTNTAITGIRTFLRVRPHVAFDRLL